MTRDKDKSYQFIGQVRGRLYGFFSALFKKQPDLKILKDFIAFCQAEENISLLPGGLVPCETFMELERKIYRGKDMGEASQVELRYSVEYAHLFLLPWGVYPFESFYRGKKRSLMDKPWEEVRNFYGKLGATKDKRELHPEDHISVELGFMSFTSFLAGETAGEGGDFCFLLELQADFLAGHLLKWVPGLKENIVKNRHADLYRPVICLLEVLCQKDLQELRDSTRARGKDPATGFPPDKLPKQQR